MSRVRSRCGLVSLSETGMREHQEGWYEDIVGTPCTCKDLSTTLGSLMPPLTPLYLSAQ